MASYVSPLVRYHRQRSISRAFKEHELMALGTLAAGVGAALTAMLYATGKTKLAAALAVTGALAGAIITAAQIMGTGEQDEKT